MRRHWIRETFKALGQILRYGRSLGGVQTRIEINQGWLREVERNLKTAKGRKRKRLVKRKDRIEGRLEDLRNLEQELLEQEDS